VLFGVLFLYIVAAFTAARLFARREGYYSTVTVFGVACFIYYLAIPTELAVFGITRFPVSGSDVVIDELHQVLIGLLAICAFGSFVIGYAASGFRPTRASNGVERGERSLITAPFALGLLATASVVLMVLVFRREMAAANTYVGNYTANNTSPVYAFLQRLALFATAGLSGALMARQRKGFLGVWLVPTLALFAWGIYSSNKDPILLALLAVGSRYAGVRSRRLRWFVAIWCVALGGSAIGPIAFSQFRAGTRISVYDAAARWGIFRQSDPAGPMSTLAAALSRRTDMRLGETYAEALVLWIPRSLWGGRPLGLAEDYARNQIKNWAPGRGLGYSLLAESYLNFGVIGPLIQYFLIGLLWGWFWALVQRAAQLPSSSFTGLYSSVGFYLLIIAHRGATSSLVTPLIQFAVPLFLCGYVVGLIRVVGQARVQPSRHIDSNSPVADAVASGYR
jgi:hypothetical protein